ncbi:MAG: DUF523 and DUF1722 domain-containing protein [SAR324 cluster bacterium]|nr:DUF523 and DUF1722 domain-containing protein [SAR324 cluster bacterium]
MMEMKPIVVVSRCLGFEACRYDGQILSNSFIQQLAPSVEIRTVCPEVEIGMGTPRAPIKIVMQEGIPRLIQSQTEKDFTRSMQNFCEEFVKSLKDVDGFILKNRSPSCGIKDTKTYSKIEKGPAIGKGPGLFGGHVLKTCGGLAIEDEGRLNNTKIREHFLMKLFTLARFRESKREGTLQALMRFQSTHKLLLMAYNQAQMRKMGKLIGSASKTSVNQSLFSEYERELQHAFSRPARIGSHINALMHALGYFSKELKSSEKAFFLDHLEKYRNGQIPLITLLSLIQSWTIRFDSKYLRQQFYLTPFPESLLHFDNS